MKQALFLLVMVAAACASDFEAPDAELVYSIHDQVTTCDRLWDDAGGNAEVIACEHACVVRPEQMDTTLVPPRCVDGSRPCARSSGCAQATNPTAAPADCAATFYAGDVRGCCLVRTVPINAAVVVPTFYECPPPRG